MRHSLIRLSILGVLVVGCEKKTEVPVTPSAAPKVEVSAVPAADTQARIAFNRKAANAKKLLEAVPAEARHDPGYLFAYVHALRQDNKIVYPIHDGIPVLLVDEGIPT